MQFIDARDLARFAVRLLEDERTGTYDVTGRPRTTTIGDVLRACTSGVEAEVVWVDGEWLEARGFEGWQDMPLWIAPSLELHGFMNVRIDRALEDGMTLRPLTETVEATRTWLREEPIDRDRVAGISREREAEILKSYVR
ncbi:MAG: hypothetical protein IAI48_15740 [Candidatus Eremiobacteraeota bacterium]|nr:hypothetical protein [Candidatus Eremiobacteraeota bacterium]